MALKLSIAVNCKEIGRMDYGLERRYEVSDQAKCNSL